MRGRVTRKKNHRGSWCGPTWATMSIPAGADMCTDKRHAVGITLLDAHLTLFGAPDEPHIMDCGCQVHCLAICKCQL